MLVAAALPASADVSPSSDVMPSFNGIVQTVAYAGNTIYVGGDFTTVMVKGRKAAARSHLAAIDAGSGTLLPWAPEADGRVTAIATSGSAVYVAGDFGRIDGIRSDNLAQLDGASGDVVTAFKHSITGRPAALAVDGGRLYLGGSITKVDGSARTGLAAFNLATGLLDAKWKPTADDRVEAIAAYAGRIYIGGRFHKVNSVGGYARLAALHPSTGRTVTTFRPKAAVTVYGIAAAATGVYSAHGGKGGTVNAYTATGAVRWTATFDGDVQAVTMLGGTVYAGGHFDRACRTTRTGPQGTCLDGSDARVKLAALDVSAGTLKPWAADANGVEGVLTMASSPALGAITIGGAFTTINGKAQKRLAQFS